MLLLLLLLSAALTLGEAQPSIVCHVENGPSPELWWKHDFTPSDLFNISAEIVEMDGTCQLNITWILKADAGIFYLNATKICVTPGKPYCVRCRYTEKFQNLTRPDLQNWQFHYIGFPVEENKEYMISAYNLPPANLNEDHPNKIAYLHSPDCQNDILKHSISCIEKGSLWDPNITICYRESEVEVNFTTSPFCSEYRILLYESSIFNDPTVRNVFTSEGNDMRISQRISVNDQSSKIFIELIPYFPRCGGDCRRYSNYQEQCTNYQEQEPEIALAGNYVYITVALLLIICTFTAVLYFKRRHGVANNRVFFYRKVKPIPIRILIIYSPDACFQHIVLVFAEFLRERCRSDVAIDVWQRRKIAETGPVQWLASQKETADKIIFLSQSHMSTVCDSVCEKSIENNKNSESMFTLALNLFCSDLKNQSSLHKYMVVSFSETQQAKSIPSLLNSCPKYFLMKDMDSFCRDLSVSLHEGTKTKCSWRSKMKFMSL
nr:interleukin-17 receptor B [Anolis sagrei ordinatus]